MGWWGSNTPASDDQARLARLEMIVADQQTLINHLCAELGVDPGHVIGHRSDLQAKPVDLADIRAEVLAGRKIQAIKIYRERTGTGLKEAKEYIDQLEASMGSMGG